MKLNRHGISDLALDTGRGRWALALAMMGATAAHAKVVFQVPFTFTSPTDAFFGRYDATNDMSPVDPAQADSLSTMEFVCPCSNPEFEFIPEVTGIRELSDSHLDERSDTPHQRVTNAWWSWGQFLLHDMVGTLFQLDPLEPDSPASGFEFTIQHPVEPGQVATMVVRRVQVVSSGGCRAPVSAQTPQLDGSVIYSTNAIYMRNTLRDTESMEGCRLKVGPGDFPPLAEDGSPTFLTGDARSSVHAPLSAWHVLMVRAHNWVCDDIEAHFDGRIKTGGRPYYVGFTADDRFNRAKNVTAAWMLELTKDWLAAAGMSTRQINKGGVARLSGPETSVEFAAAAARLFDDAVPLKIGNEPLADMMPAERYFGVSPTTRTYDPAAANAKLDALFESMAKTPANAMDGKMSDAVRNVVFGQMGGIATGFDLATAHIFRGRELGLATYRQLTQCFGSPYDSQIGDVTQDAWLAMAMENGKRVGKKDFLGPLAQAILMEQFKRSFLTSSIVEQWNLSRERMDECCKGYVRELRNPQAGDLINLLTGADVQGNVFAL